MSTSQSQVVVSEFKRHRLWVNPHFQIRFMFFTLGTALVTVGLGLLAIWLFIWKFIDFGNKLGYPPEHEYFKLIYKQAEILNLIFLVLSAVVLLFSCIYGLLMSNKIAGPVYRIKKELDHPDFMLHPHPIHVRTGDYFQDLVVTINRTLIQSEQNQPKTKKRTSKKAS